MDHKEQLFENWSALRNRILQAHPRRRSKVDVLVSLDKEFIRLARGLLKLQVSKGSYKIIQVDTTFITKDHVTLKSRDGFTINVYERDYELFQEWAHLPDDKRTVTIHVFKHGYRLKETAPNVKKPPKQAHEIAEEADKLLNGNNAGDI